MQTRPQIEKQAFQGRVGGILVAAGVCFILVLAEALMAGDTPSASEAQVKAVFLFNFAKYVDWPASAFSNATAPIIIGVVGTGPLCESLQHIIEGKEFHGRPFVIQHLTAESELGGCQILFINNSESSRVSGILVKASAFPILTVGEDQEFAHNGGIINFVLKNGNVRLEIDLVAAKKAGLVISSRLLAVADVVKGKTN